MIKRVLFERKKVIGVEATDAYCNALVFNSAEVIISAESVLARRCRLLQSQLFKKARVPHVPITSHCSTSLSPLVDPTGAIVFAMKKT